MPYNPYYANQYMPNGYNSYYQNQVQRPQEQNQPMQYNRQVLQGGIVTSIDEVKAISIPLDGSPNYFALADGSAVVSKQLQQDGTSKIIIYKPIEQEKETKYLTQNDINNFLGDFNPKDIKDIKEEIKSLKKQIRNITDDIEDKKGE